MRHPVMRSYRGKKVLITGSAQGIGRKLARRFARDGATLVLTDIQEDELASAATEMMAAGATAVHTYGIDVTDTDAVTSLGHRVRKDLGGIDVLINNAGVVFGGAFADVPLERHMLTYKVNTLGVVAMTHAFMGDLIDSSSGQLVNIASASGLVALPFGSTYASSKWAVIGFSESIRVELEQAGKTHVKITTVCPSYINTGMFAGVKAPFLTPILDPDVLVDRTFAAIAKAEEVVLEPFMVKTLPVLRGLLPRPIFDRIADVFGVSTSMNSWRGHSA